jgi:acetoin utilization protein AcuC
MTSIIIGYTPSYLGWKGSYASPRRAHLAVEHIIARAEEEGVDIEIIEPTFNRMQVAKELSRVHSKSYVANVLRGAHKEHPGQQGQIAALMFEGTRVLVDKIIADGFIPQVYFNPQGAKHHAGYDDSSGFCVFNDMAYAATVFTDRGLKVAYLDWDVHHGDGVEALTRNNPNVLTASIHQFGIFPGTGLKSQWKNSVFNFPMAAGDGDEEFLETVAIALEAIKDFEPDVFLLAAGADGLNEDPLGSLRYTLDGIETAATMVGKLAKELNIPVLIGGAGGYTPFTFTPLAWHTTVWAIHDELKKAVKSIDEEAFDWSGSRYDWDRTDGHSEGEKPALDEAIEEGYSNDRAAHIDAIMDGLEGIPSDCWEDVLTREEYDLVASKIEPIILADAQRAAAEVSKPRRKGKRGRR